MLNKIKLVLNNQDHTEHELDSLIEEIMQLVLKINPENTYRKCMHLRTKNWHILYQADDWCQIIWHSPSLAGMIDINIFDRKIRDKRQFLYEFLDEYKKIINKFDAAINCYKTEQDKFKKLMGVYNETTNV